MASVIFWLFIIVVGSLMVAAGLRMRDKKRWSDWDEEPITDEDFPDIECSDEPGAPEPTEKDYLRQIAHDVSVIRTCVEEKTNGQV